MLLFHATLQDLETIYLKFCTALEIVHLRNTCWYFYRKIPQEWTVGDLYVTESLDTKTSEIFKRLGISIRCRSVKLEHYLYKCKFVENVYVNQSTLTQVRIGSKLNNLTDMVITGSTDIEHIMFQNVVPNLKHVLINKVPYLKKLQLPDICQLRTIHISNTSLECFDIHPSWTQLKTIILVNVEYLQKIHIPSTCVNVQQINISNTMIHTIVIDSIFKHILYIQAFHLPNLKIITSSKNDSCIRTQMSYIGTNVDWEYVD